MGNLGLLLPLKAVEDAKISKTFLSSFVSPVESRKLSVGPTVRNRRTKLSAQHPVVAVSSSDARDTIVRLAVAVRRLHLIVGRRGTLLVPLFQYVQERNVVRFGSVQQQPAEAILIIM